jgi:hypothetical protein
MPSYKLKFMSVKISRRISFLRFSEILAQKLRICFGMQPCGSFLFCHFSFGEKKNGEPSMYLKFKIGNLKFPRLLLTVIAKVIEYQCKQ